MLSARQNPTVVDEYVAERTEDTVLGPLLIATAPEVHIVIQK